MKLAMAGCGASFLARHIPEDVVTFILLRLPLKFAVRFKCVCKSWCAQISKPNFIIKSLNWSVFGDDSARLLLKHVDLSTGVRLPALSVVSDKVLDENTVPVRPRLDFPLPNDACPTVKGPCNGILLLCITYVDNRHDVLLWNPTTGNHYVLPQSNVPRIPNGEDSLIGAYGFGFDPRTGDYKVIRFLNNHSDDGMSAYQQVELFSLKANSWKEIPNEGIDFDMQDINVNGFTVGTYMNANLHWLVSFGNSEDTLILVFDVSDEVFHLMPIPDPGLHYIRLFLFNDMIGLVHSPCDESQNLTSFNVWVMHQYGVKESWVKVLTVGPVVGLYCSIGFWRNGEFLLERRDGQLFVYDPSTQKLLKLQHEGTYGTQAIIYKESLTSIPISS
ncbi:F-box/kelch-repeat protein At3g06240-like [Malania oleifera]|uniref:F-box/kelch-repeat protein At3g06240-like n=1 Tax=Malania oleifera TaxID=397392 RepID=UPI0025AE8D76|nr:F-box/kelch-repeat protein At3g06240-like [Malania oleifera]